MCSGNLVELVHNEVLLSKCAIVLGYLSLREFDFSPLDRVLRLALKWANTELVMESISTALLNMLKSSRSFDILLNDDYYINMMIKVMRGGNISVQSKIAQVMRNLCTDKRCAKILLQPDACNHNSLLISDFIVIALLRSNSEDIKHYTCQTLFNVLCHEEFREAFLQGDIWWAMVKLAKDNIGPVHCIVVRALTNLTAYPDYRSIVQHTALFGLIKDMTESPHGDFLMPCLKSLQNLFCHSADEITSEEVCSILYTCQDSLLRTDKTVIYALTLQLLIKAAEACHDGQDLVEFVHVDLLDILINTQSKWVCDKECRRHVSQLLALLARFSLYTSMVSLSQIESVTSMLLKSEGEEDKETDKDIAMNCMNIMIFYINRDHGVVVDVLKLSTWKCLMGRLFHEENEDLDLPQNVHIAALTAYALCFDKSPGLILDNVQAKCIVNILMSDLPLGESSVAANAILLVHRLAVSESLSPLLLQDAPELFRFLNKLLINASKIQYSISVYDVCSTVIRNLSIHPCLLQKLLISRGLDGLFRNLLITPSPTVYFDLVIAMKNFITIDLDDDYVMSPRFIILQVISILDNEKDNEVQKLAKKILSKVFDKYSNALGYDARFIQSLLTDLHEDIEEREEDFYREPKLLPICSICSEDNIRFQSLIIEIHPTPNNAWSPLLMDNKGKSKGMSMKVPLPCGVEPIISDVIIPRDTRPIKLFNKINKLHPTVVFDCKEEMDVEPGCDEESVSVVDDSGSAVQSVERKLRFE
mmetsp:Transcript_16839/g.16922  ORF Transcript_16839/g.16922 Transcript_16839/m.16922 type:complete len:760 (+) Transcript_16839:1-2280(+)